jgi:ATP-dependent protease ClpP protease subunit
MSDYVYYMMEDIEEPTAKDFAEFLASVEDGSHVTIQMLSHGGLVFAGLGVCQMIAQAQARGVVFDVNVYGIAASAASDVSLACDHIYMADGAQIMVHSAYGGSDEGIIRANQQQIALIHKRLPSYSEKDLEQDRWFDAETAIKDGLADGYIKSSNETRAVYKLAAYLSTKQEEVTMAEELKAKAADEEQKEREDAPEAECGDGNEKKDESKAKAEDEKDSDLDLMEALVQRLEGIESRLAALEGAGNDDKKEEEDDKSSASARRKALMQKLNAVCAPMPSVAVKPVSVAETPEEEAQRFKATYKNFDSLMADFIKRK